MPNSLQQVIYNLSALAPLLLLFAIVWLFQEETVALPIVSGCIAILLIILMRVAFCYGRCNLPLITIEVTSISTNDKCILTYVISYVLPFASITLTDYNLHLLWGISAIIIVVAPLVKSAFPNPILFFIGYHYYTISAENGVSGYILISKRNIRNVKDVKKVRRVFEFLLEDVEGM